MSDIKWQEPPPSATGRGSTSKWAVILATLRDRPGEWALVAHGNQTTGANVKRNRSDAQGFEFTSRKADDGKYDIYARYVGEVSA